MAIWMSIAAMGARITIRSGAPTAAFVLIVPPSAKEEGHAGKEGDGGGDGSGHRASEDVAILDVAQFVGDDAFEFLIVHHL
jgi:hypothetical protein